MEREREREERLKRSRETLSLLLSSTREVPSYLLSSKRKGEVTSFLSNAERKEVFHEVKRAEEKKNRGERGSA